MPRIGNVLPRFKNAQHMSISSALRDFNPARIKVKPNNRQPSANGVPERKASPQIFNVSSGASPTSERSLFTIDWPLMAGTSMCGVDGADVEGELQL